MNNRYDVVVIGGGPAGMMAAARAASLGSKVLLLDKNEVLGRKMLITGGGRCNLTNDAAMDEMIANIPGNGKFVYSALHRFSGQDLRVFLKQLGIPTKVEERGRVFPVSDRAGDVVAALEKHLRQVGVTILYGSPVDGLLVQENRCLGARAGERTYPAGAVVLATGGMSYPKTGSTGEGYKMAKQVGHSIAKLFPSAVAVTCGDDWIANRQVQGLSLPGVAIRVYNQRGKVIAAEAGDVIFTHWGISGPGVLRVGRTVALERQKEPTAFLKGTIDLFPGQPQGDLEQQITNKVLAGDRRSVKNLLTDLLPERMARVMVTLTGMDPETSAMKLNKNAIQNLAAFMKGLPLQITGTRPIEEATVTGGGVNIKEVDPRTMGSKLISGLYFAGEVLDVDAHTGGFNMQVAFSTGAVAGESAAAFVKGNS